MFQCLKRESGSSRLPPSTAGVTAMSPLAKCFNKQIPCTWSPVISWYELYIIYYPKNEIKCSSGWSFTLIFHGYQIANQVMVCWDPWFGNENAARICKARFHLHWNLLEMSGSWIQSCSYCEHLLAYRLPTNWELTCFATNDSKW